MKNYDLWVRGWYAHSKHQSYLHIPPRIYNQTFEMKKKLQPRRDPIILNDIKNTCVDFDWLSKLEYGGSHDKLLLNMHEKRKVITQFECIIGNYLLQLKECFIRHAPIVVFGKALEKDSIKYVDLLLPYRRLILLVGLSEKACEREQEILNKKAEKYIAQGYQVLLLSRAELLNGEFKERITSTLMTV